MPAAYYESYSPVYGNGAPMPQNRGKAPRKEEDTEQAASLLLMLGRSVTPEPSLDDSDHRQQHTRRAPYQSFSPYASLTYDSPYADQPRSRAAPYEELSKVSSMSPPHSSSPYKRSHAGRQVSDSPPSALLSNNTPTALTDIDYEALIEESQLVQMKDRDLVPDSLFVAMAQMKPCKLTHADRVGCYKSRDLGFLGMCCKHCGGQPGFGRYYPNSVRSLAQTTTSQTILKHIGNKCRFCPPQVRAAVLQLQQQSSLCEGMSSGRPRYGSRKIFFQRVWARLHQQEEDDDNSKQSSSDADSTQTPTDLDESSTISEEEQQQAPTKRKNNRFGPLPLRRNHKRAKTTIGLADNNEKPSLQAAV